MLCLFTWAVYMKIYIALITSRPQGACDTTWSSTSVICVRYITRSLWSLSSTYRHHKSEGSRVRRFISPKDSRLECWNVQNSAPGIESEWIVAFGAMHACTCLRIPNLPESDNFIKQNNIVIDKFHALRPLLLICYTWDHFYGTLMKLFCTSSAWWDDQLFMGQLITFFCLSQTLCDE